MALLEPQAMPQSLTNLNAEPEANSSYLFVGLLL
jgi:hypothetical protein